LNNDDEELSHLERTIVEHAKKRYRRFVFRQGHLVAWLVVPIAAILFIPAMQIHQQGLSILILLMLLLSQSFVSTRIIGKLAASADLHRNIEPGIPPREAGFSLGSRPGLLFYVLVFPIALIWVAMTETHFTWSLAGASEIIAVESVVGFYTAIIAISGGALGTVCTRNQPIYGRLMSFGGEVAFWFFVLIAIAAVLGLGS
jgi:hypothetical protein